MAKRVWVCELCSTMHGTREEAEVCERMHPKEKKAKVVQLVYADAYLPSAVLVEFVVPRGAPLLVGAAPTAKRTRPRVWYVREEARSVYGERT
jgi:hypothetical protein